MKNTNSEFEILGLNHIAMVCKDMQRTVDFYTNVLGMELTRTLELPAGGGQHFFFSIGGEECFAFFWFPDASEREIGISNPQSVFDMEQGNEVSVSSHGSMNHFAFNVAPEKIEEYYEKLIAKGVNATPIFNHDTSPAQVSDKFHEGVWMRSIFFQDPDGIMLEFACNSREFSPALGDRKDAVPATSDDVEKYIALSKEIKEK
ncbi:MAG: VOC family protein [Cyanobacteria bacterium J06600_6]